MTLFCYSLASFRIRVSNAYLLVANRYNRSPASMLRFDGGELDLLCYELAFLFRACYCYCSFALRTSYFSCFLARVEAFKAVNRASVAFSNLIAACRFPCLPTRYLCNGFLLFPLVLANFPCFFYALRRNSYNMRVKRKSFYSSLLSAP